MKSIIGAVKYIFDTNGGAISSLKTAMLIAKLDGLAGIRKAWRFALGHSGSSKSEPYKRVSEYPWLESLVLTAGQLEPEVLTISFQDRRELPVYFHKANSSARMLEDILNYVKTAGKNIETVEIVSGADQFFLSPLTKKRQTLRISNARMKIGSKQQTWKPKEIPRSAYHDAVLRFILTFQPRVVSVGRCRFSRQILKSESLILLNSDIYQRKLF
jgi:hypothetical protein